MLGQGRLASFLERLARATPAGRALREAKSRRVVAESGLFDAGWYRRSVPEAPPGGEADHYLRHGAREGHDPHPLFDSSFYLETNPDVARAGLDPLVHYVLAGAREGRDPHPLFDSSFYSEGNPDVTAAGLNPLTHYCRWGAREGRAPNPVFHLGGETGGHDWASLVSGPGADAFDRLRRGSSLTPFQGWLAWALGQAGAGPGAGRPESARGGIVFVASAASPTGAAHLLLGLLRSFRERTRTALYAVLGEGGSLEAAIAGLAPTLNLQALDGYGTLAEAAVVLRGLGATVAFCAGFPAAPTAIELRRVGIRVVVLAREETPAAPLAGEGAGALSVPLALARDNPFLRERGFARMQVAKRVPVGEAPFLVLGCGHGGPRAGSDLFVAVARELLASGEDPGLHFVWVGQPEEGWLGPERPRLEGRVHAPGEVADPSLYFAAADVFLLTSREETLPLVALEAMEAGLPVVAFEGPGKAALAGAGAALLVSGLDPAAMARAVARLRGESELRRRLGSAGSRWIQEGHRPDGLFDACATIAGQEALSPLPRRWPGSSPPVPAAADPGARPLVSVVIPSYNHARFVEGAIRSVAAQDYPRVELIVVDDGSTDDSLAVVDRALADLRVERCVLERQSNLGTATALDRAVRLSRGEYVAVLNSDDCYLPGRLRALVERVPPGGDVFAFTAVAFGDEAGRPFPKEALPPAVAWYREAFLTARRLPTAGFALLARSLTVSTSNFFFSRGLFEKLNGFAHRLRLCHDWDFVLRATHHVEPVFLATPLLLYRHHRTNTVWGSGHLRDPEGRAALASLQELWGGPSPNPLAPSPANWPSYFPEFARRVSPWFSPEPLAVLLGPNPAAPGAGPAPERRDPREPAAVAALARSLEEGEAPASGDARGMAEAFADCERAWSAPIPRP